MYLNTNKDKESNKVEINLVLWLISVDLWTEWGGTGVVFSMVSFAFCLTHKQNKACANTETREEQEEDTADKPARQNTDWLQDKHSL